MQFTKITTIKPAILSKRFKLNDTGELIKYPGGQLVEGWAEKMAVDNISELAELLSNLTPGNALTYGVTEYDKALIVTQSALKKHKGNGKNSVIARTRQYFSFPSGAGLLMLDYDPAPGERPLTATEFREALKTICPAVEKAPYFIISSASSYLFNKRECLKFNKRECLKGPGGWRVLVAVKNAADIQRAGGVLFKRSWLSGMGYIFISKSGAMIPRSIIDLSVWQPERLDFCAGAACEAPLEQRRPDPEVYNPETDPLDTAEALKSLSFSEEAEFERLRSNAIRDARPAANEIRDKWVEEQIQRNLVDVPDEKREETETALRETFTVAAKKQILLGDFVLYQPNGRTVTVGEVLDDPNKWHGKRFGDPLEPNYQLDKRIAFLNLRAAGRPYIWSHAHGGTRYILHRARKTIRLIDGERFDTVRKVLELMRINGTHYQRGEIVTISQDGEVIPRDKDGLLYDLDGLVRFERYDRRSEEWRRCDCKPTIAAGVLAARGAWKLPKLTGISTAPLIDPVSGRLIDTDGYDSQTGLMLILNDISRWPGIPETSDDGTLAGTLENAVQRLWKPFAKFPFDGPISRGVWLNAILTGVTRPLLPTAPGVAVTSPIAGSGKTFLAKCAAEVIGEIPSLLPDARNPEEIRKRLLALLRQNKRVLILDNVVGVLDSSALCVVLTSEFYEDRVLGVSETIRVPTRTLLLITGNNITLRGDLCRRVLTCRIDPEMETPWKRTFELDPVQYCRTHRLEMVRDALTIIRTALQIGPKMADRTASFELWSDTIRRGVCLVGKYGFLDVTDPVESIDTAYELDPETAKLGALMAAWWKLYQDKPVKVSTMIAHANEMGFEMRQYPELHAAVDEIAGEGFRVNSRRLGRWIERNHGRLVDGMRIIAAGNVDGVRQWCIKKKVV